MKKFLKISSLFALSLVTAAGLQSCASDDPFDKSGEADVRMRFVINSDVTRAEVDDEDLRANCVVYISSEKGLIHKFKGLENVPEVIRMKCGHYVAEAWTGDSVPASFDKKFYRGYMPFDVETGVNSPVLKCGIANVVASVNASTLDPSLIKDYKVTIGNSAGSLDFTADNAADAKGYYMMPDGETQLTYTISATNAEGKQFTKQGVITGKGLDGSVERAHEYVLNFTYNPEYEQLGGAFLTISIDDRELLIEDEIEIFGRPAISGMDFDIDRQVVGNAGAFGDKIVKVAGFGDIKQLSLFDETGNCRLPATEIDLMNHTQTVANELAAMGISFDKSYNAERNLTTVYITFGKDYLNTLPEASEEYRIRIYTQDINGKSNEANLRLAVGEGAIVIDDPVTVDPIDQTADLMAVGASSATLFVNLISADAVNPGLEYKLAEEGDDAWRFVSLADAARQSKRRNPAQRRVAAQKFKVSLSGLQPGKRYAYRGAAEGFKSAASYFTTEEKFQIPNADMEGWNQITSQAEGLGKGKSVWVATSGSSITFWDSGNHGSAAMNTTLTEGSSDMFTSGSRSARLHSMFVGLNALMGKFAAGNLFAGDYVKTDGTDGVLKLGRSYNGSHPKALKVMCNYRPGKGVNKKGAGSYIAEGADDVGQIYIALSTERVDIMTKNASKLFNPHDACIVAYGVHDFNGSYGPDGALQSLEIPFEYYSKATTTRPLYLIIVCTASKYGDYFQGGEGSLMYLDDFELVY